MPLFYLYSYRWKMTKVRILTGIARDFSVYDPDTIVELEDNLAASWSKAGIVEIITAIEVNENIELPETATPEKEPEKKNPPKKKR